MEKVFISYARKDSAFVRRLHEALEARGREVWVDWEGIPPVDQWLARIRSAIDEADALVFVISPDSVASEVCGIELDHAVRQHKRLIPVVYREVEAGAVRHELAELNYIFARDDDSFDIACETLIVAIETDLEWVRAHTRLLVRAAEWDREGRDASYTLRGRDLDYFEDWLARSPDREPRATAQQSEYLLASRRAVTRRQRIVWASVAVGLSIAVGLATIAHFQSRERARQETIAEARQLVIKAEALRDGPVDAVGARVRLEESTRAAVRALAAMQGLGMASLDADRALRRSLALLPKWIEADLRPESIDASAFDVTGAYLTVFRGRDQLMVWDTAHWQSIGSCPRSLAAMESVVAVAAGRGGTRAATAVYRAEDPGTTELTLWAVPDCNTRLRVELPGRQDRIALAGGGLLVAHTGSAGIRIWDGASGAELSREFADRVLAFAPDPDGHRIATIERNRGERVYWVRIRDLNDDGVVREWVHSERGEWLHWGPQGLVVGSRGGASIHAVDSGALLHVHPSQARPFALSPDGRRAAVVPDPYVIQIRDALTGTEVARTSHDTEVADLAFGADSASLTTVDQVGRRIRAWYFDIDEAFATLRDEAPIVQMRFSDDEPLLHTTSERGSSAWQLPAAGDHAALGLLDRQPAGAESSGRYRIAYLAAGRPDDAVPAITVEASASAGEPSTITVDARALAVAISPGEERLAIILATGSTRGGDRRRLEIWDLRMARRIAERTLDPVLDPDMAAYLQFAGGDRYLAVGTRTGVEIVDAQRLTPVATLYHPGLVLVAVQGDGRLAATKGRDGEIRVWRVDDFDEIARIEAGPGVVAIELGDAGRWLATLDDAGILRLWPLTPDDLIRQACRWLADPCP
jgi:WD40 repeat protein